MLYQPKAALGVGTVVITTLAFAQVCSYHDPNAADVPTMPVAALSAAVATGTLGVAAAGASYTCRINAIDDTEVCIPIGQPVGCSSYGAPPYSPHATNAASELAGSSLIL